MFLGAFQHRLGKTRLEIAREGVIFQPAGAWTPAEGSSPFFQHVWAQLPERKYQESLFEDVRGSGSSDVGAGIGAGGWGCAEDRGDLPGTAAHSVGTRQAPWAGRSRQQLCQGRREGERLWAGAGAGDVFSAAGLSPFVSFPELAGLELLVSGITAGPNQGSWTP